jgi:hypothetical protein
MSSPRSHGVSRRQNVLCRILVPIQMRLAFWTIPFTDIQRQLFYNMSTGIAAFRGWEKTVNHLNLSAVHTRLRFQHCSKLAKRCVTDRLGKAPVFNHTSHIQVFDAESSEPANKVRGQLVQRILSAIRNLRSNTGNTDTGKVPAFTALYPSGKNALSLCELHGIFRRVLRISNPLPVGKRCQSTDPQIDPNGFGCFSHWLGGFIKTEGGKVSPIGSLGYRDRRWFRLKASAPLDVELADLGKRQGSVPVNASKLERTSCVFGGLFFVLLVEGRIFRSLLEEVLKGGLKVAKRLLNWDTRNLIKKSRFGLLFNIRNSLFNLELIFSETYCLDL